MNIDSYVIVINENQIVYQIMSIINNVATIKGYTKRIIRNLELNKLQLASKELIEKETNEKENYKKQSILKLRDKTRDKNNVLMGTILHIDGDKEYLESCKAFYDEMKIHSWCIYIKEKEIKEKIKELLEELTPDVLVITGHDAYNGKGIKDINNYENSDEFIKVVRVARKISSKEDLVIIVGACASHFEALIASGANFASSPARINIHTYDPAILAVKVASTSCNKTLNFDLLIKQIIDGRKAFGGIETKGKMRIIY